MATRHSLYQRQLRQDRKDKGLCTECGQAVVEGYKMCERHRQIFMAKSTKRKHYLHSLGLCVWCGKVKTFNGAWECFRCQKKSQEADKLTRNHKEEYKKKRERGKLENICYKCNSPLREGDKAICCNCREMRDFGVSMRNRRLKEYAVIN